VSVGDPFNASLSPGRLDVLESRSLVLPLTRVRGKHSTQGQGWLITEKVLPSSGL